MSLKNVEARSINQSQLTSECWLIQFRGLKACQDCELKNSSECGGQEIRKLLKNAKGLKVPLGSEVASEKKRF